MKKVLAFALCLAMLLSATPVLAEGAVYTALYSGEVSTLNYLTATSTWDQTVGANVVDTLVEYNSVGEVIPGLAESWEQSPDQLTWTFHLRQGQKWYDYTGAEVAEVTADDFVNAMKYVLDPVNESGVAYAVYTAHVANAENYFNGLTKQGLVDAGTALEGDYAEYADVEVIDFDQVGIKAVDKYTVEYTLDSITPYFLSCLTYGCFMPAYGPQLEEQGTAFATACDKMYYCGAFILTEYEPQVKHTYIKNVNNWDAEHVLLDGINRVYNSDSSNDMMLAQYGETDTVTVTTEMADSREGTWYEGYISRDRAIPDYSYFYAFNFNPQYADEYGQDSCDNWGIAVNNSNFRHSIMSAFNRLYVMTALEPNEPETLLQNAITPSTFASVDGMDYTALPAFDGTEANFYDEAKAAEYKAAAIEELTAAGCTFPIQIVLTYKANDSDWEDETTLLKQQLESLLGTDYITCELNAGPSDSFLTKTRRAGKYSIMRCNWGADYADPETWAEPFAPGNSYNKMDLMLDTDNTETKDILIAYYAAVDEAKASTTDTLDRYTKFATAEAMLVNNAMVIPYNISAASYQLTKLNIFEGEYAPFGMSNLRYKYQTLHEEFITTEEYNQYFADWMTAMGNE